MLVSGVSENVFELSLKDFGSVYHQAFSVMFVTYS